MLKIEHLLLVFLGTIYLVFANAQDDKLLTQVLEREEQLEKVVEKLTDFIADNALKTEAPITKAPKAEGPITKAPKAEGPITKAPKAEGPITKAQKAEGPKTKAPKAEGPITKAPKAEGPKTDGPNVNEAKNDVVTKDVEADLAAEDQDERISKLVDLERRLEGMLHESDSEEDVNESMDVSDNEASRMQRILNEVEGDISRGDDDEEIEDEIKGELMNRKEKSDAKPWWGRRRRSFHLAPHGAYKCDYGQSASHAQCEVAARKLAPNPRRSLQNGGGGRCFDGSWGQVPLGCSAQTGGDKAAHYKWWGNTGPGCIHRHYQLVCTGTVRFHLAPHGAYKCDYGHSASHAQCEAAASNLAPHPRRSLQVGGGGGCLDGSWGQVPLGCSAQTGGDKAAHYKWWGNTGSGCIHRMYQLVCTGVQRVG